MPLLISQSVSVNFHGLKLEEDVEKRMHEIFAADSADWALREVAVYVSQFIGPLAAMVRALGTTGVANATLSGQPGKQFSMTVFRATHAAP